MASKGINKVIIVGNLGKDPEMKYTATGSAVCNITVATSESWNDKATGEKVEKTDKQRAVDVARHAEQDDWNARAWGKLEPTPLNRLKLCEAYLARLTISPDADAMERLKDSTAAALRSADAAEVLGHPHLMSMVRQLFGERGLNKLKKREVQS